MRTWSIFLTLALALVFAPGCTRESPPGGPGANKSASTPPSDTRAPADERTVPGTPTSRAPEDRSRTFTVEVPAGNTNVKQGERTEVRVRVDRGRNFDQDVTLTFKPAGGVRVEPATVTVKSGQDDARVTLHADAAAAPGSANIEVTGTPASGAATSVKMGIDIKKRD